MIYTDIIELQKANKLYDLILSDPPWPQGKGGKKKARPNSSGGMLDYPTLTLEEIKEHLQIATDHTCDNAILFLWVTDKFLVEGQKIAESCGWKLHMRLIWDKGRGQAPSFDIRFTHEYLLYMYKGKFLSADLEVRGKYASVFREQNKEHSRKPDVSFEIIEGLYPNKKYLEMYARKTRQEWDSFGNELKILNEGGLENES